MSHYYQLEGPSGAPVVVLSNSLGTTFEMWQPQMAALLANFRVLRYDTHGHGRTAKHDKTTLPQLAEDVISVMDDAGVQQAHFCGISMGGLTGLWLARFASERFLSITVANSAAKIGEQNGWLERARNVRLEGMSAIAKSAPSRWFTEDFARHHRTQIEALCSGLAASDAEGYASCCEALAAADLRGEIDAISLPTLFIAGVHDPVTTVADSEFMQQQVSGAHLVTLNASHLSNIEDAHGFNTALLNFIQQDN
ncbi:3-oxoadipate enol-lactonase [Buttiauxella sp. WJP83]|uniref:3-oxoadipate enol-lactonase n=1 Tax=Buttiauxella sp. WJP83 TaxID=2986951 RepID=UPI0022DE6AC3|nr:3-oxoadipate enol-lactonase [Buttiauxella sp. WJP83]WBM68875.1 3-oxoadipate enol-lactonase [Buttiauxella sp. WJP83]